MTTPPLSEEFIEAVRRGIRQGNMTERKLAIAMTDPDDPFCQEYFAAAIRDAKTTLWNILSYGACEEIDDPGRPMSMRAMAAQWLLHGHALGYWAATKQERKYASAIVVAQCEEAPMSAKDQADLARKLEVPLGETPKARKKRMEKLSQEELQRIGGIFKECAALQAVLNDGQKDGWARLAACRRYFAAMEFLAHDQHRAFWDKLREQCQ